MSSLFGSWVAFTSPWLLGLLATLPLLWWLLRLTPPAPKKILFPALALLRHDVTPQRTPAHTPWWILLLRMILAACLIVAFANPILNPQTGFHGHGPLLIIVDNDWASARAWNVREQTLHDLIHQAERDNRQVLILPTTLNAEGQALKLWGPMTAQLAYGVAENIKPQPWPAHWQQATAFIQNPDCPFFTEAVWLSSGLGDIDAKNLYDELRQKGDIKILNDRETPLYLLAPPQNEEDHLVLKVYRAIADNTAALSVVGLTKEGRQLVQAVASFARGAPQATAQFNIPLDIRNQITRFEIVGPSTAATTVLLDDLWQKRSVGLVGDRATLDQHSLLNGVYYIDRALKPFVDLHVDTLSNLLKQKISVIILTDETPLTATQRPALVAWIKQGGLFLRFAGKNVAATLDGAPDDLLPVALRNGDRAMSGSLSWGVPQKLHEFPVTSPFHGLIISSDIVVNRQVLAEPSPDLQVHSWAALEDGTPLVTEKNIGQGLSIFFHIPVQSDWSNLPLSGLFVDMLRRLVDLSQSHGDPVLFTSLQPWRVLDAFGEEQKPSTVTAAITRDDKNPVVLGPLHPPGLYGTDALNVAVNVGDSVGQPDAFLGVKTEAYRVMAGERELRPYFLVTVFLLFLIDFGVSLFMRGLLGFASRKMVFVPVLLGAVLGACPHQALATTDPRAAVDLTAQTYLAYIQTDTETNHVVQQGLTGLAHVLQHRTSLEQMAVVGVNPDKDDLAFYTLLYWPIKSGSAPLSAQAVEHVNSYLHHGGMILFDTMQGEALPPTLMQHILAGVDVPALIRVPSEHVLKHSFYILNEFPGRYDKSDFWLEPEDSSSYDGVATVLYGVNGWAEAWAVDDQGRPLFPCIPGGEAQRELAYRFGVNLVMYALTGNYKSDQLHAQVLLRKLGK